MTYPTLKTLTVMDIALLGVFMDDYEEKFRGTRYDGTLAEAAYKEAWRVIRTGVASPDQEIIVRATYEARVRSDCFTQKGTLGSLFKREVYTPRHVREAQDAAAVKRMQERRDRKTFEELKAKYGW